MSERTIKWVLLVSLLANALLVGFMVGQVGRGHPFGGFDRPMAMRGPGDRPMDRPRGDEATRTVLREAFAAERPAVEKAIADIRAARAQSAALVRAETLDAAALDTALAQMRLASDAALASFHRSIAAAAAKLDAEHRGALARMLERAPGQRNARRGPPGPPPPRQ